MPRPSSPARGAHAVIARLNIVILFCVAMVIASCDVVPAPASTVDLKKLKTGQICGKTASSGWVCTKE